MPLDRRTFIRNAGLTAAAVAAPMNLAFRPGTSLATPPKTGFETTGTWTTHEDELSLLATIAADRPGLVRVETLGRTNLDRPLHLVTIGATVTKGEAEGATPTVLLVGSQHGNEPAGREACLKLIRDLAYTDDLALLAQLRRQTVCVIPSANPDGRAANQRQNASNIDINRDHLTLETPEAQAIAVAFNRVRPSLAMDLHEYGPSVPVVYDDDVLYLWPRNLNVDRAVQDNARSFCLQYLRPDSHAAGYTADEYGLYKVGPNVGPFTDAGIDIEAAQTAGGPDEGICRNAMGLRHAMGILVESRVMMNPAQGPQELVYDGDGGSIYGDSVATRTRRVDSQLVVSRSALRYLREQGEAAKLVTDSAGSRKARAGAERDEPLYFDGADNAEPTRFQDPPPSAYAISAADARDQERTLDLHGIAREPMTDGRVRVTMAQRAEPVVGLLLDDRADRAVASGEPLDT